MYLNCFSFNDGDIRVCLRKVNYAAIVYRLIDVESLALGMRVHNDITVTVIGLQYFTRGYPAIQISRVWVPLSRS